MAQPFTSHPSLEGHIVGFVDDVERSVVIELLYQTSVLLSDGAGDEQPVADSEASPSPRSDEDELFARLTASMQPRPAPADPALRRLLPDGVKGDDAAAGEFRRYTEDALRARKLANLETAMRAFEDGFIDDDEAAAVADGEYEAAVGDGTHAHAPGSDGLDDGTREIVMTIPTARATMMALTDVRLVLAERLGIRTDADADELIESVSEDGPETPEQLMAAYYDFLTWLSETITLAVMGKA